MSGNCFPLSLSQLNILNLERSLSGTSVNNISTTIRINGRLDFPMLQKSIDLVLENDSSLRTRLAEENGEVVQYHAPFVKESFPVYDFTNTSKEGISNWETAVTRELIPLFGGPLYRFVLFRDSESSGGILVKLHHIIADGWSQILLCNKIGRTYIRLMSGQDHDLTEAPDYLLHVKEEQDYVASPAYAKDESYWRSMLSEMGEPSVLKSINSAAVSPVGCRKSFDLPEILNHAIYSYCEKNRVAPFAVFYMALAIYFKRNGGADHFTIGVPIFNRTNFQFKQSTGMFVTTLPFHNDINDEWTLDQFNDHLAERWFEMLRHQRYPFSRICELAGTDSRLFHIALSYQDSKIYESRDVSVTLSGRWHYCGYQAEQLAIHLTNLRNNRKYAVDYDYLAQFFTEDEIVALHRNLCHILSEALSEPDRPIHRLNVLSLEEKDELLYQFNDTDRYLKERSVYDALVEDNARHSNRVALIHCGERMTYGAMLHRASQFAGALSSVEVSGEGLTAILLPRKFDLFCAMVGVLEAGQAYVLLSDSLPTERIKTILAQSNATALITDENGKRRLGSCDVPMILASSVDATCIRCHCGSNSADSAKGVAEKLAYVVYTSGSTGEPKGVEISQKNLLNLSQEMRSVYGQGAVLSVCNVGFDAFMLESIVALLNGRTIVLPLESDLESPESLASLMNGYAVGFFSMTPSRLSALLHSDVFRKVMWRMESIICGGEHFPPELLKKLKTCTPAKIYNQYGPSETTVAVSMKELSDSDKITVGSPLGNCKLYVLDQWMNPLPIGGSGRLYVGGACVGRGYRNRPELTEKAFRTNPFVSDDRIYDTGDLAYWTSRGEVVLTGRADRQVKLRGLRIELQEIASCLESHPLVIASFAKICDLNGQKVIGAYYTSDLEISEAELLSHTATYLPEYMIPTFILRVSEFATTPNGKIDEDSLPVPVSDNLYDGEVSETAQRIVGIFREVLSNESIHGGSDYFLSGGNSLNALECILRIEEVFGKKIRIADLYACRNAIRVAQMIDGGAVKAYTTAPQGRSAFLVKRDVTRTEYPLTPTQQGIYVQSMLDPSGLSYNMPGAFLLEREPDLDRLTAAFSSLIESDPIFRTSFVQGSDGICARIAPSAAFEIEILTADTYEHACEEFLRPFDLSKAPLLRAAVWKSEDGKDYLFLDSHHIVGDGLSTPIILQRLDRAYSGMNSPVKWDFYDYVHTVIANNDTDSKKDLSYWVAHLKDLPDPMVLPSDFVRPQNFDFKGNDIEYVFTENGSALYAQYCKEHAISEFVLFLAAYGLLLSSVSGSNDLIIGTPVAGRNHIQSSGVCGPFINTLPLRLTPKPELTVNEWLESVKHEVSDLLDHQNVSLEEIISALGLPRGEMNALYRVMLTQSPVDESVFTLGGDKMSFRPIATGIVKMDLVLELAKRDSGYALRFSYASSVFDAETIRFYGRCMEQAVKALVKQGDSKLSSISLLSAADKERYVETPNYSVTPFVNRPVHHLLKNRSLSDPDQTAVIFHGTPYTYSYIEKRACYIASFLEEKGIGAGQCVGLCLHRTQDMIATMYGVLKAGCSYMFMLDSFPEARLQYMAEISCAAAILYDDPKQNLLNAGLPCDVYELPDGESDSYEDRPVSDSDLVNILFTSGSTGKPKGVMLRHRSVSNLYSQMKTLLDPIEGNVLCSTNTVFDCFVVETMIALALGRTVVLADEEEMMLPWKLAELVENHNTGIFEMTPSRLQMCLGNEAFCSAAKNIKIVLLGGEVITRTLRDKFYEHSNGILMNMYGPTEATVFTTMGHVKPDEHITIGSPLQNTRTYVLDEAMRPVLPTAYGELYIAGECLSAGYVSRPDITEQSFVDDIYFPGQKMYRSGDIVRQRLDGRFDYLGRKDAQIKLNGQRVELTEINGAIEQTGFVKQAATVAIRKEDGSMELCSYYVPNSDRVTDESILSEIALVLPKYMIPARIVALSDMPLTATNKVDMQTLIRWATSSVPVEHRNETVLDAQTSSNREYSLFDDAQESAEYDPSFEENDGSRIPDADYVLSVWNKVLSVPATSKEESFFKLGGTSMSALNVLSIYYNDGFEMSLSDFYQATTASAQAELLCDVAELSERSEAVEATEIAAKKNGILVTGATGFFGIHLLKKLAAREEGKIVCIMRDGNTARMARYLAWYFNEDTAGEIINRIEIVKGDVSEPHLGLDASEYERLVASVQAVYHCAADVRHFAADTDAYLKTNVGGTENMLTFAKRAGASFYHMSTCSVSGDSLKDDREHVEFSENDYDIGQNWEDNIYVKSKFMAEGLVRRAIDDGLDAKIFRLGRLVGRADDGKFQINPQSNAFYLFLRGISQIGSISRRVARTRIELTPIDLCVDQVLALRDASGTVYHIMNEHPPTMAEILNVVCPDCRIVTAVDFAKAIKEKSKTPDGKLLPFVLSNLQMTGPRRESISVSNRITMNALKAAEYVEPEYKLETILKAFEIEE